MMRIILIFNILLFFYSCQKEEITIGENVSEAFFLKNKGASMRILVEGNTAGKTFLVFVHGGPGSDSYSFNTDYISNNIEDKFACVYWDQRNSGSSQGNANGEFLTLEQMTADLVKLLQLIKYRYGQDVSLFICGHSFGGLLTSSFMTSDDNQSLVKGWIFMDGDHNYLLNDSLVRDMLLIYGQQEIDENRNVNKWTEIVRYCNTNPIISTEKQSSQLNAYAHEAETYFDEVTEYGSKEIAAYYTKNDFPISSAFFNVLRTSHSDFIKGLNNYEFTSKLQNVTTPTLILFGKYDFICPPEMGHILYNTISSTNKSIVISPISGHYFYHQDEELFCNELNKFIYNNR